MSYVLGGPSGSALVGRASLSFKSSLSSPPDLAIAKDTSRLGWGAAWGQNRVSGHWSLNENDHINVLELRAIFLGIKHWAHDFRGATVTIHCNNKTAISYILKEGGTHLRILMLWAKRLLLLTDHWQILLHPAYFPGMANLEPDALSRGKLVEEWEILPFIVDSLFRFWGVPQVDLFASAQNAV